MRDNGQPLVDCAVRSSRRIEVQGGVKEDNNIELLSSRARESARRGTFRHIASPLLAARPFSLFRVLFFPICPFPFRPSYSHARSLSLSLTSLSPIRLSSSVQHLAAFGSARRGVPSKRGGKRERASSTLFRSAGTLLHARKVISAGALEGHASRSFASRYVALPHLASPHLPVLLFSSDTGKPEKVIRLARKDGRHLTGNAIPVNHDNCSTLEIDLRFNRLETMRATIRSFTRAA